MAKWYLFWILTVQNHSGDIFDLPIRELPMLHKTECSIEARAKEGTLNLQLGKKYSTTDYYGGRVRISGYLVGFTIGCEERFE